MEVDLDLDDLDFGDKKKEFLEHKLKEVKNYNNSIKRLIDDRRQHLSSTSQSDESPLNNSTISSSFRWKKCFNKKYAICYEVQHNNVQPLVEVKPLLKWSSSKALNYETYIYDIKEDKGSRCTEDMCQNITNNLIKSSCINSKGYIVIVISIPDYLECLEYIISGTIMGKQKGKVIVDLSDVKISSEDITNREMFGISLLSGNIEYLLVSLLTSNKTDLLLTLPPDWGISLDSTFEIHCSLSKINVPNSCKTYLVANRIAPAFDDIVMGIHNHTFGSTVWATVYSSCDDALLSFLHHLHQHIPGLIVIPGELCEDYNITKCVENENALKLLEEFQKCVNKELELIESATQSGGSCFRSQLTDVERATDFLYLKICELNNFNKN